MQTDKSATILEAQWIEKEIPRLEGELQALKKLEQDLLTTPLETVSQAYTETYRTHRKRTYLLYHRRRSVTPTRYGYRERMRDVGWLAILARVLIIGIIALAAYVAYHNHQIGHTTRGAVWGSVLLVFAILLAFSPMVADQLLERLARVKAEHAAEEARGSEAFLQEKAERQAKLRRCRERIAELQERLQFARIRFDELRKELTTDNHHGEDPL
ncbi:MAG: hypothetical protein ISS56_00035 [Anaerolineae bacterium]|nr:hypothetical protein [Anaerolineae bacterium]